MLRVHRVKAEGPGLSSMSPDRTNKRRKRLRKQGERERVNNKAAAKVVRLRWEYRLAVWCGEVWCADL